MQLHQCLRDSIVRLLEDARVPPGAPPLKKYDLVEFGHIDGMYSYCKKGGEVVHLAAWTEVEFVRAAGHIVG